MAVFDEYRSRVFPFRYHGEITVERIAGGIPTNPKVQEGWLRSKLEHKDSIIRKMVGEVMVDRGVTKEEAASIVDAGELNGFKRDDKGLYIEGRQLKAGLKEAAMVAANAGKIETRKWGDSADAAYRKGLKGWFPEHVFVEEVRLHLGVAEATGIAQRFVHTWRGTGIQNEEYVDGAVIGFTIITDHKFTDEEWAMIWVTGEQQGIGASRSQGYGRYELTAWDPITKKVTRRRAA